MIVSRKDIANKVTKTLDSRTKLPKKRYTLLCKKEEFGISKNSKQPMVTRTWEIIAPETVRIDGADVFIAGTELVQYLPLGSNGNPAKKISKDQGTINAIDRYLAENIKLGLNGETVDTENPALEAEGLVVEAICYSKDRSPTEDPDEESGKREPIYDPLTNKPLERYEPTLGEILGISQTKVDSAF